MTQPIISVIATGGTVAGESGKGSSTDYQSGVLSVETLLRSVPGLDCVAGTRTRQIANIGSEDMTDEVWFALVRAVLEDVRNPEIAGVVVLHGTDTMEETAFFLDLTVEAVKPVVLTGAMRPADVLGADGPRNIFNSVALAALAPRDLGVVVCMDDAVHFADRAVKTDTLATGAFQSPSCGPVCRMANARPIGLFTRRIGERRVFSIDGMDSLPRVEIIYGHAGQTRELIDSAVATGAWGIVHAGVGMGMVHRDAKKALEEAAAGGVAVVAASRVAQGPVPDSGEMRRSGFIPAGWLNPQKARVLLQLTLAHSLDIKKIAEAFAIYGV